MFSACSGYRFTQQENPLAQYGISCLSVPMFYNYSNIPDLQADFTRETYRLLTGFPGLKLKSGYSSDCDAVLIGIIKSKEKLAESLRPGALRLAKRKTPDAVGSRQNFSVPGTNLIGLGVHVIVIKRPTEEELAILKSGIGDKMLLNSRLVFNDIIPVSQMMTRELLDGAGTQVVATQNLGVQRKTTKEMSIQTANSIRDLILYAF